MVILETAAIGAAGYGLYRGGDAAIRKGKETQKELQRERVRQSQRSELSSKIKTRQERIAQLVTLRQGTSASTSTGNGTVEISTTNDIQCVDDRHRTVMEKLRKSRSQTNQDLGNTTKSGPSEKRKSLFGLKRK